MKITVSNKAIANAVKDYVNQGLYYGISPAQLKKAGVPGKKELAEKLLKNKEFMDKVARYLSNYINDVDVIADAMSESSCKELKAIGNKLENEVADVW